MPQRKYVTLLTKDNQAIPYGGLKQICKAKGWNENILYQKKLPFEYEGYLITKEKIRP